MTWFDDAQKVLERWKVREAAISEFWKPFTPRARQSMLLAKEQAQKLNHNYVGTEHILLGLLCLEKGSAVNIFKELKLSFEPVHAEVVLQVGPGPQGSALNLIPFTPRLKKVLRAAKDEAKTLGHTYVGTDHIFLGLLGETEGPASQIFKKMNIDCEKVRQTILNEIKITILPSPDETDSGKEKPPGN